MVLGLEVLPWPLPFFPVVWVLSVGLVLCCVVFGALPPPLWWELPWPPPWLFPGGVVLVVVVVVVDVVVFDVVVVVVVVVHEAWTFLTGPVPGGTRLEAGVPGGALTSKVSVWPVSSVTVTLHWSAEALGSTTMAMVASADPAEMARSFSFRRTDTVV